MRALILLLSLSVGLQALAEGARPDDVVLACEAVEKLPVSHNATTPPTRNKAGGECDPLELYYGTSGKPDYAAARPCALAEWHNPNSIVRTSRSSSFPQFGKIHLRR
jgi:hypothetical protein